MSRVSMRLGVALLVLAALWAQAKMADRVFLDGADPKQALDQAADEYAAAYR